MEPQHKHVTVKPSLPCAERFWGDMDGSSCVRSCDGCGRFVYNMEAIRDGSELAKWINKKEGTFDGRLFKRGDGTLITRNCPRSHVRLGMKLVLLGALAIIVGLTTPGVIIGWST